MLLIAPFLSVARYGASLLLLLFAHLPWRQGRLVGLEAPLFVGVELLTNDLQVLGSWGVHHVKALNKVVHAHEDLLVDLTVLFEQVTELEEVFHAGEVFPRPLNAVDVDEVAVDRLADVADAQLHHA